MSFSNLAETRRSARKYLPGQIPRQHLIKCLEAARLAPSACNSQPWTFVVVDDPKLKDQISAKAFSGIYSMNQFAREASALIVVVSEKVKFLSAVGGQVRGTQYYLVDIGIACEHFILQATELGIASCWIGWFDEKPVKEILKIPKSKKIDIIISLGYGESLPHRPKIRKSLEEMSSFNTYNG